ncbi:uncharacterized protein SCDLUD_004524 [Saccharomycodes ludwigii]|uniref:uncharacterized protein n=1 Tax=Saccharomycodes ludwigii TaxID=36035 RepID=UPI001E8499A8|nr:hypothetical protein SCDLUD_004524 [Saccharomycodes ludwigii]KAH3899099.1 hypothetical protein SCDLUD_004524 [Saccharomycodes ludwigii]
MLLQSLLVTSLSLLCHGVILSDYQQLTSDLVTFTVLKPPEAYGLENITNDLSSMWLQMSSTIVEYFKSITLDKNGDFNELAYNYPLLVPGSAGYLHKGSNIWLYQNTAQNSII